MSRRKVRSDVHLCRCRGERRFYSAFCPDRENHTPWHELPPYWDLLMQQAADYHKHYLEQRRNGEPPAT